MKNTYSLIMTVDSDNDTIVIDGKCPHCMEDEELMEFIDIIHCIFQEAYKVAEERNIYGKSKSKEKQR